MSEKLAGRVIKSDIFDFLSWDNSKYSTERYLEICTKVLTDFRNAIEGADDKNKVLSVYEAINKQQMVLPNSYISRPTEFGGVLPYGIYVDCKNEFDFCLEIGANDGVFYVLAHELGHYYTHEMYLKKGAAIPLKWSELMSDFFSGFIFGLDSDHSEGGCNLRIEAALKYQLHCSVKNQHESIDGIEYGFKEILNGRYPPKAMRIAATEMGYQKGLEYSDHELPLGLEMMKKIYDEFIVKFYEKYIKSGYFDKLLNFLREYNKNAFKLMGDDFVHRYLGFGSDVDLNPELAAEFVVTFLPIYDENKKGE